MGDLRTLAQAVVDADDAWNAAGTEADMRAAARRFDLAEAALDHGTSRLSPYQRARTILAALNAADARGYARAMGDVVERCDHGADYPSTSRSHSHRSISHPAIPTAYTRATAPSRAPSSSQITAPRRSPQE